MAGQLPVIFFFIVMAAALVVVAVAELLGRLGYDMAELHMVILSVGGAIVVTGVRFRQGMIDLVGKSFDK